MAEKIIIRRERGDDSEWGYLLTAYRPIFTLGASHREPNKIRNHCDVTFLVLNAYIEERQSIPTRILS